MNILVISDKYPPYFAGGYELACQHDCQELAARGHDITILCTNYGVKQSSALPANEILPVKRELLCSDSGDFTINFQKNYWFSHVTRFHIARKNYQITKKIIYNLKPDIVFGFQLIEATFTPIIAAHKAAIPVILSLGDDSYAKTIKYFQKKEASAKNLIRLVLRMCSFGMFRLQPNVISHFISNSSRTKNILSNVGVETKQCSIIPHYMSHDDFSRCSPGFLAPKPPLKKQLKIIYGGRICEEKGIEMLVAIIYHLHQSKIPENIQVDLFGSGANTYEEKIRSLVEQYGLDKIITMYPCMEQHLFLKRMRDYHIFLFPFQWEEPFGQVAIQSMASGVVCVASNIGGPAEIITHLQTGCLCEQRSVDDFVKKIELLAANQDLFDAIRNRAFQEVNEKYSAAAIVPKVEKILLQFALPRASS